MDRTHSNRCGFIISTLQEGVRKLQNRFAERLVLVVPKESTLRKLKFGVLLLLALCFGTVAHQLNSQEFELQWRKSHLPSTEVWKASFAAAGFRRVENPSLQGRLTHTLPSLSDWGGKVWSATPDWWAVESGGSNEPMVFCLGCDLKKPPSTWKAIGSGWEAWETSLNAAREQARSNAQNAHHPIKRGESVDPRSIRY